MILNSKATKPPFHGLQLSCFRSENQRTTSYYSLLSWDSHRTSICNFFLLRENHRSCRKFQRELNKGKGEQFNELPPDRKNKLTSCFVQIRWHRLDEPSRMYCLQLSSINFLHQFPVPNEFGKCQMIKKR